MNFKVYNLFSEEKNSPLVFSYESNTKTMRGSSIIIIRKDIELELMKNPKIVLEQLCKDLGFKNISKLKKDQLIDLLKTMNNKPINFQ